MHKRNLCQRFNSFYSCIRGQKTLACPKPTEDPCRSCIPDMVAVEASCAQPKVLIVGAGLAGLSAAQRLIQCGIKDVTILEALSRPGGRIYTEAVDGTLMELGVAWITGGCPGNTVFSLACQNNLMDSPVVRPPREHAVAVNSSGKAFQPQVSFAATKMFYEILGKANRSAGKDSSGLDLWSYLENEVKHVIKYFPDRDKSAAQCVMDSLTLDTRKMFGTELNQIPLTKYGMLKDLPGGDVPVKKGMISIINNLLKSVEEGRIKYNTVVQKIFWRGAAPAGSRVSVVTCDGQSFSADYVILSLPLGVMKCFHSEMFEPHLPTGKQKSICTLGLGYKNNICIKFKKPFWIPGEGQFRTCWSRAEAQNYDHWTKCVSLIEELPTTNDSLLIQLNGSAALEIERATDCEIIEDVTQLLRMFLGDPSIPMPSHVVRSKWNSHPRFLGANAFLGEGSSVGDVEELAKPEPEEDIAPALLFAGEATAPNFQGTGHGARLSGIREAERILYYTKCFCGPPPKPPRTCNF